MDIYKPIIKSSEKRTLKPAYKLDIDSRDRLDTSSTSSEVRVNISPAYTPSSPEHSLAIKVGHIFIPHSFYLINDTNNKIKITEGAGDMKTLTLTNGNYTYRELKTHLNSVFSDAKTATTLTKTYTWDYIKATDLMTITQSEADTEFTLYFEVDELGDAETQHTPYQILGFEKENSYTGNSTNSYTITSPKALSMIGVEAIYIRCNLPISNLWTSKNGGKQGNVLVRVPVMVEARKIIEYEPNDWSILLPRGTPLNSIYLRLEDRDSNLIDLNKQDWSISLIVEERHSKIHT